MGGWAGVWVGRLYENKTKLSPTLLSWSLAELGNKKKTTFCEEFHTKREKELISS